MSVVPPLPMLAVSLYVEGPQRIGQALSTAFTAQALPAVLGLLYIVVVATLIGYGIWNTLLSRYPSSSVAPFSMLVPIVGVLSSWALFGERIDGVEALAGRRGGRRRADRLAAAPPARPPRVPVRTSERRREPEPVGQP